MIETNKHHKMQRVDLDSDEQVEEALGAAVRDALREHKRLGQSVVVWQDGKVVTLAPEDIPVDLPDEAALMDEGKTKDNHMSELIFLVESDQEGGYTARALGQSIFTGAETLEELRANIREAVQCHFEDGKEPRIIRLHMVQDEVLAV